MESKFHCSSQEVETEIHPEPTESRILIHCFFQIRSSIIPILPWLLKTIYLRISHLRSHTTCPVHLTLLASITKVQKLISSSLCNCHYSVASSLTDPNILLSTPFSNTLNLRSSFKLGDHVAQPYKTFYIIGFHIFISYVSKWETRSFKNLNWIIANIFRINQFLISVLTYLLLGKVIPKYFNFA
jgi:hypothetical protein